MVADSSFASPFNQPGWSTGFSPAGAGGAGMMYVRISPSNAFTEIQSVGGAVTTPGNRFATKLVIGQHDGATIRLFSLGSNIGSNTVTLNQSSGKASFTTYDTTTRWLVGEVMVFNKILTTFERQVLESYLANKWGLTNDLSTGNPFRTTPAGRSLGSFTTDSNLSLTINASNKIRLTAPTETREILVDVNANSSVTSGVSISPLLITNATLYRINTTAFDSVALPTLTAADAGVYWTFYNATASNESVTITGTTDIASPYTMYAGGATTIHWNGTNYFANQDATAPVFPSVTDNFLVATIGSNNAPIFSSPDGASWTASSTTGYGGFGTSVAWNGRVWMAGQNAQRISSDGSNWTNGTGPGQAYGWNGSVWVGGSDGTLRYSYDGITWSNTNISNMSNSGLRTITWGKDKFIAVTSNSSAAAPTGYVYSSDGIFWTNGGFPLGSGATIRAVAYGNNQWVIGGINGTSNIATSPDGITWTLRNYNTSGDVYSLAWNGTLWMGVTTNGSNCIITSPDAITWTQRTLGVSNTDGCRTVTWNGSHWYVAGPNFGAARVFRSAIGTSNWALMATLVAGPIDSISIASRRLSPESNIWAIDRSVSNVLVNGNDLVNVDAMVVNRGAGFSPASLPGLVGWYDASGTSNFTFSSGQTISAWLDKSPHSNHAYPNATTILDISRGRVTVGSNTNMTTAITSSGLVSNVIRDYVFAVFAAPASNTFIHIVMPNSFQGRRLVINNGSNNGTFLNIFGGNTFCTQTTTFTAGTNHIVRATSDTSLAFNGDSQAASGAVYDSYMRPYMERTTNLGGGGNGAVDSSLSEVIIYQGVTMPIEHQRVVEGYLAWKWSIASNLPTTHPWRYLDPRNTNYISPSSNFIGTDTAANLAISNTTFSRQSNIVPYSTKVRMMSPTEIRQQFITTNTNPSITNEVYTTVTPATFGSVYQIISNTFANISALNNSDAGGYWDFSNTTTAGLLVTWQTLAAARPTGLPATMPLPPRAIMRVLWDGSTCTTQAFDSGRVAMSEVSGTSATLASSNYNTTFYLTNSGFNAATLPSATVTTDGGYYWTLRNATSSALSITLTNTLNLTSPLVIPSSNSQTLIISGATSNTILLM
jgi:hypothetical protein